MNRQKSSKMNAIQNFGIVVMLLAIGVFIYINRDVVFSDYIGNKTTGETTESTRVSVTKTEVESSSNKGWIKYNKSSYTCKEGDIFDAMIKVGGVKNVRVRSYKSSNGNIAKIELGTKSGAVTNCTDCVAVHVTCKKAGKVTLSATSTTGATTSSSVTVSSKVEEKGWIKYDQASYTCGVGEVFDTMIRTGGASKPSSISSYGSSDKSIATIEDGTSSGAVTNCINCRAVHVTCKKAGTVTLSATSSTGAKTTSSVKVAAKEKGWIKYDKDKYTCKAGQVIDTMIRTGGATTPASISSFKSSNTNIAIIEDGTSTGAVTKCINCRAVHITCKSSGSVTVSATSSTGATTTSVVTVEPVEKGWIKYEKNNYYCEVGQVIDTTITTGGSSKVSTVTGFKSNNTSVAEVLDKTSSGAVLKCINCRAVHIVCKKKGNVTISATSSTGATTTSAVEVAEKPSIPEKGWIKYDQASYTCKVGQVIDTTITTGGSSKVSTVTGFKSNNTSVAEVLDKTSSGAVLKCINCRAVHIVCKKKGNVTISATSSTGATTTSAVEVAEKTSIPEKGWIKYDQASYTCKVGQVIDTMIRAGGANTPSAIRSYGSSDNSIATVERGTSTGAYTNCIDCVAVHITCKKAGSVTLSASSSTGATTTSSVKVEEPAPTKGWVKYDKTSYSCKEGQVIDTMIRAGGANVPSRITSYGSNDKSIATVEHGTSTGLVTNCADCVAVHITCKKAGNVTITAASSTGATGSSTVAVATAQVNKISFEKSSYSCKAGEVINTKIETTNGTVTGFSSNNAKVATIEDKYSDGTVLKCINCRAVHITCRSAGTVTLTATASTGKTATAKVTVSASSESKAWVKYEKTRYTCYEGEVFDTIITAGGGSQPSSVNRFGSSNSQVASIDYGSVSGATPKCINCRAVHVTCKKAGTATLTAGSTAGASSTATLTVKKK